MRDDFILSSIQKVLKVGGIIYHQSDMYIIEDTDLKAWLLGSEIENLDSWTP